MKAFLLKPCLITCLLLISACTKKSPVFETPPKHIISTNQALSLHRNYVKDKKTVMENNFNRLNKTEDFEDTKFAWLTLDDLKTYIAYIDAAQKFNPEVDVSGVRIYFGAYGNSGTYKNQQTVFMVPTINSSVTKTNDIMKHLPFSIVPKNSKNILKGKVTIIEELIGKHEQKAFLNFRKNQKQSNASFASALNFSNYFTLQEDETSLAFNEFQMSPPPKEKE